jgi:hypothetical protein
VRDGHLPFHVLCSQRFRTDSRETYRSKLITRTVIRLLLTKHQGDYKEPYDWDDYAQVYFSKAEELVSEAQKAEQEGNKDKASELYL